MSFVWLNVVNEYSGPAYFTRNLFKARTRLQPLRWPIVAVAIQKITILIKLLDAFSLFEAN